MLRVKQRGCVPGCTGAPGLSGHHPHRDTAVRATVPPTGDLLPFNPQGGTSLLPSPAQPQKTNGGPDQGSSPSDSSREPLVSWGRRVFISHTHPLSFLAQERLIRNMVNFKTQKSLKDYWPVDMGGV